MDVLRSLRARRPCPRGTPGPGAVGPVLSWIGDERIAISGVPPPRAVAGLAGQGRDAGRQLPATGAGAVSGRTGGRACGLRPRAGRARADAGSRPAAAARRWAAAACFAARVLEDQPQAGVLIHCTAGRRRSAMVAYAVLRLRGHDPARAAALVLSYRTQAILVPAYVRSVERWLVAAAR
jgi:hypothetical protein